MTAESSIPQIINNSNLSSLNTATVLQNFADISEGNLEFIDAGGTAYNQALLASLLRTTYQVQVDSNSTLKRIERRVGGFDQVLGIFSDARNDGRDADADGDLPVRRRGVRDAQILDGLPQPLFCALRVAAARPALDRMLASGDRKASRLLTDAGLRVVWLVEADLRVVDPALTSLANINAPSDLG